MNAPSAGTRLLPAAAALAAGLAVLDAVTARPAPPRPLPAIVFVSRRPIADARGVPGLGPHHRADQPGGRLMLRTAEGAVRALLPPGAFHDVSDPSVSPDIRSIAFAGVEHPGDPWRIYVCGIDGRGARRVNPVPSAPRGAGGAGAPASPDDWDPSRRDELDPCWITERTLCFVRTSDLRSQYAEVPVSNLFMVDLEDGACWRITSDRNGADEPAFDRTRGRIVYTRWWYNRFLPSRGTSGLTIERGEAMPGDTVNLWHAVEVGPDGSGLRLAAGRVRPRRGAMAYQPCVLPNGDLVGVVALNTGLSPASGPLGIQRLRRDHGPTRRIAGAAIEDTMDAYGDPRGLAAPSAVSPAALPDGRIVFAYDPGARGEFGLYVVNADGSGLTPVVDLPGTLELDPSPVIPWSAATRAPGTVPAADSGFTFFCRNLFATGPIDSPADPAPPFTWPLRIRFYEPRLGLRGDTAVLVREAPVRDDGSILEHGLPAGRPMFEQIVDANGLPLATAHGAAHVPGYNYAPRGAVLRCVGCHAGHSALPAGGSDPALRRFDAAPSAAVSASSRAPGTAGPQGAVDRRARGNPARIAWIAAGDSAEWIALAWPIPVRVREVALSMPADDQASHSLRIERCQVTLWHKGRITARRTLGPLGPRGGRMSAGGALCDRLEIDGFQVRGEMLGARRAALAEIEVVAECAPEGLTEPAGPRPTEAGAP